VDSYKSDRVGLVLAYWAIALHLGRPLVSQTDHDYEGSNGGGTYGSILNHITVGRHARRAPPKPSFVSSSTPAVTTLPSPCSALSRRWSLLLFLEQRLFSSCSMEDGLL